MNKKNLFGYKEVKKKTQERRRIYVHNFQVITDCPWLTQNSVEMDLREGSEGYKYEVKELDVL